MSLLRFAVPLAVIGFAVLTLPALAGTYWQEVGTRVGRAVDSAAAAAARGDKETAKRTLSAAYFVDFEDSKLEAAIRRQIGAKRAAEIEKMFADLRKAIVAGDNAAVAGLTARLRDWVAADAKILDAANVSPQVYEVNQ